MPTNGGPGRKFYHCYLLCSLDVTNHPFKTYIGFSTHPQRRIRQHNGDLKHGGARKTKRAGRPWQFVCVVGGFSDKISALQFEWAWQHPQKSRLVRQVIGDMAAKTLSRRRGVPGKLAILKVMLVHSLPYRQYALSVYFLNPDHKTTFESFPSLPPKSISTFVSTNQLPMTMSCHAVENVEELPFWQAIQQTKAAKAHNKKRTKTGKENKDENKNDEESSDDGDDWTPKEEIYPSRQNRVHGDSDGTEDDGLSIEEVMPFSKHQTSDSSTGFDESIQIGDKAQSLRERLARRQQRKPPTKKCPPPRIENQSRSLDICFLCCSSLSDIVPITCDACHMKSHVTCLADLFLENKHTTALLPEHGSCPSCNNHLSWARIMANRRDAVWRQPLNKSNNDIDDRSCSIMMKQIEAQPKSDHIMHEFENLSLLDSSLDNASNSNGKDKPIKEQKDGAIICLSDDSSRETNDLMLDTADNHFAYRNEDNNIKKLTHPSTKTRQTNISPVLGKSLMFPDHSNDWTEDSVNNMSISTPPISSSLPEMKNQFSSRRDSRTANHSTFSGSVILLDSSSDDERVEQSSMDHTNTEFLDDDDRIVDLLDSSSDSG